MKHHIRWIAALAVVVGAVAAGTAAAGPARQAPQSRVQAPAQVGDSPTGLTRQMRRVKAALDKYQDVAVAEAAGYHAESPCESTPTDPDASWWGGAMGIHYVNDSLLGAPITPKRPAILTYVPGPDGQLELLAAEYFKVDADQNLETDDDRPSVFGRAFDGPMLGHAPGMPIHYDLHVWFWKHNPSGIFAPWNPDVTCPS